jgi:hypothetical protein
VSALVVLSHVAVVALAFVLALLTTCSAVDLTLEYLRQRRER